MRWPLPWGSKPAGEPEVEEEHDLAVGHHRHLHVEHNDVETESASSKHWPALPVEEAVHVEDPDAYRSCCSESAYSSSSGGEDGDYAGEAAGGGRRPGRRPPRRHSRRRRPSGLPVHTFVGAAAAVLLVLVAVVASWRRRQHRPATGS